MNRHSLERAGGCEAISEGIGVPPWLFLVETLSVTGAPSPGAVPVEAVLEPKFVAYLEELANTFNGSATDGLVARYELFVLVKPPSLSPNVVDELLDVYVGNARKGQLFQWQGGPHDEAHFAPVPELADWEEDVEVPVLRGLLERLAQGERVDPEALPPESLAPQGHTRLSCYVGSLQDFLVSNSGRMSN
jgi:hypothetical protein